MKVTERRTKSDCAESIRELADHYQQANKITLIMDNLNTHNSTGSLYETFPPEQAKSIRDRFEFVYTPKHGSWLNIAEIKLNMRTQQCLNRRIACIEQVRASVSTWQIRRDNLNAKVYRQFITRDARVKLRRLYQTL